MSEGQEERRSEEIQPGAGEAATFVLTDLFLLHPLCNVARQPRHASLRHLAWPRARESSDQETISMGIYLECRVKPYTVEGRNVKCVLLPTLPDSTHQRKC